MMLTLHFPIRAISKDNEKIFNRQGRFFTSKRFKDFENEVQRCCVHQLPKDYKMIEKEGIIVEISAMYRTRVRCDAGNISKGILDAHNGILWKDDKLITTLIVHVVYGDFDEFMVKVSPVENFNVRALKASSENRRNA